jgi:hypothetical protein
LELKSDSTFKYEWTFDLASNWAVGRWSVSNNAIHLIFENVYDTLVRDGTPDTLVFSMDEKSDRINEQGLIISIISSRQQGHGGVSNKLAMRGRKLYEIDDKGRIIRARQREFWTQRKRPTYYYRVS